MRSFCVLFFAVVSTFSIWAAENINFSSKPLTAGKASLTENGFIISKNIGTVNFSPELRYPIQLIYSSASEKTGVFGFAWNSPQLESSAYYDKDGVLWTTPWGEKIKFFPQKEETPKDAIKLNLYEQAKKRSRLLRSVFRMGSEHLCFGKETLADWRLDVYRETPIRGMEICLS